MCVMSSSGGVEAVRFVVLIKAGRSFRSSERLSGMLTRHPARQVQANSVVDVVDRDFGDVDVSLSGSYLSE